MNYLWNQPYTRYQTDYLKAFYRNDSSLKLSTEFALNSSYTRLVDVFIGKKNVSKKRCPSEMKLFLSASFTRKNDWKSYGFFVVWRNKKRSETFEASAENGRSPINGALLFRSRIVIINHRVKRSVRTRCVPNQMPAAAAVWSDIHGQQLAVERVSRYS